MQRCLRLLDVLARDGVAFARRLYAARSRPPDQPDPARSRARINHLLHRALLALRHAATLAAKLAADPSYRGEPTRPARARAAPCYRWSPPLVPAPRRRKPGPFEQVFAGRSVGQIIDHIRNDLGLPGRIGPLLDQHLARSPPDPRATAPKPISLPPFAAILRRVSPRPIGPVLVPPTTTAISPGTGPPH